MKRNWIGTVAYLVLLACMTATLAYGQTNSDKVKIKGLITGRTGETLILRTGNAGDIVVVLTDDTKVQKPKGLGLRHTQMSMAALIPGLKVEINGVGDARTKVVAQTINFSQDDLEAAEAIQAGLTPTQRAVSANQQDIQANKAKIETNAQGVAANKQQIEANQQDILNAAKRFSDLTDYDIKSNTRVNFAVGRAVIPADGKAALKAVARDAQNLKGFIIQVEGFADSSGNPAMNQQLSMQRAEAVLAYLIQDCNIPVRHIVAPGAMGTANPIATNETAKGRAENRRVEVKVLMNKGLAGS